MNLKFWKKEPAGIAKIEASYMDALADLCSLAREERIRKLVDYMMPSYHVHKNGKRKPKEEPDPFAGVMRVKYPSGNEL